MAHEAIAVTATERLPPDTDLSPASDTWSAIQDYSDWLKAGNPSIMS